MRLGTLLARAIYVPLVPSRIGTSHFKTPHSDTAHYDSPQFETGEYYDMYERESPIYRIFISTTT